jgi:hypothetical protein
MTNLFRNIGFSALMITGFFVSDASAQAKRPEPLRDMSTGVPRNSVAASNFVKTGPTIVPVIDSNAILNLDYKEMRSAPAAVAKPAVAPKAVVKEPTLAELRLQLRTAEDEYKASQLAYTQAVRAKDNVRVENAKMNRAAAQQKVADLKRAVAAKQPAAKRAAPKKKSGGADRAAAAPAPAPTAK